MNYFNIQNNVRISTAVNINLSAQQWNLYTEFFPRYTIEKVATYLNNRFNQGYNRGMPKERLVEFVEDLMKQFSVYGASDGESRKVLDQLLEQVYPS